MCKGARGMSQCAYHRKSDQPDQKVDVNGEQNLGGVASKEFRLSCRTKTGKTKSDPQKGQRYMRRLGDKSFGGC